MQIVYNVITDGKKHCQVDSADVARNVVAALACKGIPADIVPVQVLSPLESVLASIAKHNDR